MYEHETIEVSNPVVRKESDFHKKDFNVYYMFIFNTYIIHKYTTTLVETDNDEDI